MNINNGSCLKLHQALYIGWDGLEIIAAKLLNELVGREIAVSAEREDYYYWNLNIDRTPLSKKEIQDLFLIVSADDYDRESNEFGEYPVTEINQGLATKILARELPFIAASSHAVENGVWFFGPSEEKTANILVTYPETECFPDCLCFTLNDGIDRGDLLTYFHNVVAELPRCQSCDRLTHLDTVIDRVAEDTGCKVYRLPIHSVEDIW